jgi:hypothetical protein
MEQRAAIAFCIEWKKTATDMFEITVKNVDLQKMCLDGMQGSKKGENRYKTTK